MLKLTSYRLEFGDHILAFFHLVVSNNTDESAGFGL